MIVIALIRGHYIPTYSRYLHATVWYRAHIHWIYPCVSRSRSDIWSCIGLFCIGVLTQQRSDKEEEPDSQSQKGQGNKGPTQYLFPVTIMTKSVFRRRFLNNMTGAFIERHRPASVLPVNLYTCQRRLVKLRILLSLAAIHIRSIVFSVSYIRIVIYACKLIVRIGISVRRRFAPPWNY